MYFLWPDLYFVFRVFLISLGFISRHGSRCKLKKTKNWEKKAICRGKFHRRFFTKILFFSNHSKEEKDWLVLPRFSAVDGTGLISRAKKQLKSNTRPYNYDAAAARVPPNEITNTIINISLFLLHFGSSGGIMIKMKEVFFADRRKLIGVVFLIAFLTGLTRRSRRISTCLTPEQERRKKMQEEGGSFYYEWFLCIGELRVL